MFSFEFADNQSVCSSVEFADNQSMMFQTVVVTLTFCLSWAEVIYSFSFSTQQSMNFQLQIHVKIDRMNGNFRFHSTL